jgi:hypothetical protein
VEIIDTSVRITYDELRKLMKDLPRITRALKACDLIESALMIGMRGKSNTVTQMIAAGVNILRELGK